MNNSFFDKINYSACNEDSESERKALQLMKKDIVLCITGSGARPLDLLIDNPEKIISIDFNATQNYLLMLKIAAYKTLNYSQFKSFIGLSAHDDKIELYNIISKQLLPATKIYWDKHLTLIKNGVLYCGTWELLQRKMLKAAFLRRKKINALMQFDSIEAQKQYWEKHWDNWSWRFFLKLICNRFLWTKIIREPGAILIPKAFNVYQYIYERINYLAKNHLLKTNHFANLIFYGKYHKDCILPIHLREENFETIKKQVDKIEVITDSLLTILGKKEVVQQVTAYSLSDFSSYCNAEMYADIWKCIVNNCPANAKFCERQFLVKRSPELLYESIIRNTVLEDKLMAEDLTAIYSFCVGQVRKL